MSLSIILPAYQEAENIPSIVPKIHDSLQCLAIDYEILIVDTMEPLDNTKDLATQFNFTYCPRKSGNDYGDAIRTGFESAQYDRILVMDCDGSHSPEAIKEFWEHKDNADLIIGSRYVKGGKTDNPPILIFLSYIVNLVFRIVLGLKVKDISNSFRMYTSSQVKALSLECNNFDLVEEILIKLIMNKPSIKILEIPISFNKREHGASKRDLLRFILSYIKTLASLWKIKYTKRNK